VKRSVIFGAMLAVCGLASVHAQTYTFTDLGHASGVTSAAANINNLGQVVGLVKDANGWNHAVTWVEGQAVHLGLASGDWGDGGGGFTNPWGMYGEAIGINDAGQIAWTNTDLNKVRYATVWPMASPLISALWAVRRAMRGASTRLAWLSVGHKMPTAIGGRSRGTVSRPAS
jgi:probable HAF family extracellular repeat protein